MTPFKFYASILFFLFYGLSFAQEDWTSTYEELIYDEVIERCDSYLPNDSVECLNICVGFVGRFDLKFKVALEYKGKATKIEENRAYFIDKWVRTYWPTGEFNDMFQHEIQFSYDDLPLTIIVQEPTLKYYSKELKKDDSVYLYLMFAGILTVDGVTEYIFVANEFEKK